MRPRPPPSELTSCLLPVWKRCTLRIPAPGWRWKALPKSSAVVPARAFPRGCHGGQQALPHRPAPPCLLWTEGLSAVFGDQAGDGGPELGSGDRRRGNRSGSRWTGLELAQRLLESTAKAIRLVPESVIAPGPGHDRSGRAKVGSDSGHG